MALPSVNRFQSRRGISDVIRRGRRHPTTIGRLAFIVAASDYSRRFLAVVPNAVSKKSTVRHRLKRRLESLFYRHREEFPPGLNAVLTLFPNSANMSKNELTSEFKKIIRGFKEFKRPLAR